jgi:carboxyl-terminal processing protease
MLFTAADSLDGFQGAGSSVKEPTQDVLQSGRPNHEILRAFQFRGIEPEKTTERELLQHDKWRNPEGRTRQEDGSEHLEYRLRGYKKIIVVIHGNVVQTIDVLLPDGVSPTAVAQALELGQPRDDELTDAATAGTSIPDSWRGIRYSAGRVALFVDSSSQQPIARLMRVYASRILPPAKDAREVSQIKYTLNGQDDTSRRIVQAVIELFEERHFSHRKVNDEIALRWMNNFLSTLDPNKFYFLQPDVDRFRQMSSGIDDRAKLGDIGFAYTVFKIYAQRYGESLLMAREYMNADHDFTLDEEYFHTAAASFPENQLEAREIWRKRIKYEILQRRAKGADDNTARKRVSRHFNALFHFPETIDDDELLDWCITSLAHAYDPHSNFYSPRELQDFEIQSRLQLVGIGAALRLEDGNIVVTSVVPGGPADKDGRLQAGDIIVEVADGDTGASVSVVDMQMADAVQLIRGKQGTVVRLRVVSQGGQSGPVEFRLVRDKVVLQQVVRNTILTESGDGDRKHRIGIIVVPTFYSTPGDESARSSTRDTRRILEDFRQKNVDSVVLDMRSNGGGRLPEAIEFPGLFLDTGVVTQLKDYQGKIQTYAPVATKLAWKGPLVVLTNRSTGTGAEIFVGAIKDYRRGLIVGDSTTYGSGTVQSLVDIGGHLQPGEDPPKLGALRLTSQMFYRPNGQSVQLQGVAPDIKLPSIYDYPMYGEAAFENTLAADKLPPADYQPQYLIDDDTVSTIAKQSQGRRSSSREFQNYLEELEANAQKISRKTVTLNEEDFLAEYGKQEETEENSKSRDEVVTRDAFMNEAVAIALDYAAINPWLLRYSRGMQQLVGGQYEQAVEAFTKAIALNPQRTAAYKGRAVAHAGVGQWKRALDDAKTARLSSIACRATADSELKVGTRSVAAITAGQQLAVTRANNEWLWAEVSSNPSQKGWIQRRGVTPIVEN